MYRVVTLKSGRQDEGDYFFQQRKHFDPYVEMIRRELYVEENQLKKHFATIPSSRIHAEHLFMKPTKKFLTAHKKRKVESNNLMLPTLGQQQTQRNHNYNLLYDNSRKVF